MLGRNLAFVSWMAIKGTENICVTNALLMLTVRGKRGASSSGAALPAQPGAGLHRIML